MEQELNQRSLSRRTFLLAGANLSAASLLMGRLYYLQFVKSEEFQTLSEGNRIKVQLIAPARGILLDRAGVPLADNTTNYRLFIERENHDQAKRSFAELQKLITIPPQRLEQLTKEVASRYTRKPLIIKEYLTWDEVAIIEFHIASLPGAYIDEGYLRYYPLADKAAHLIGYVGRVSESEMDESKPLFRLPEFKIGKNGIEVLLEERLQGIPGTRNVEVNATGLPVRVLQQQPPQRGEEIPLSIDGELQQFCADTLGAESGAIVVMDAHYGELLALCSMPAFDPNRFSLGITTDYWKELNANEKNPLLNKAITGLYPPGSTFKMLVGLAGLKAGTINGHSSFYCPGHYYLGNHRFNCWRPEGHGFVNVVDAIAESCDTFFYNVAERLGIEKMAEMGTALGLGAVSGLGLSAEKAGTMPTPEWKQSRFAQPWVKGDTINSSIGQGYVLTTPLQLAVMVARMINGGRQVKPSLLRLEEQPDWPLMDVDESHLALIREGMYRVSNATNGTAYWKRITEEGFSMGGKTGTSQVRRITQRGQDQNSIPWKYRHHGLFVGYAPVEAPRFACSVIVEHGGGGSSAAAPLAKEVLLKVQQLAANNPGRYKA